MIFHFGKMLNRIVGMFIYILQYLTTIKNDLNSLCTLKENTYLIRQQSFSTPPDLIIPSYINYYYIPLMIMLKPHFPLMSRFRTVLGERGEFNSFHSWSLSPEPDPCFLHTRWSGSRRFFKK